MDLKYITVPGSDKVSTVGLNSVGLPCDGLYDLLGQFGDEATSDFEKDVALILRNTVGKGLKAPPYASFHITNSHVILYWFEVEVERSRSFKVMIIQDDGSLRDSGEGPWSTWQQADDFARAEVGMNYTIEEC